MNKVNKWKPWHKWVLGITTAFILLAAIAINSTSNDKKETEKSQQNITISAAKLFTEYTDNEVRADQNYKEKTIQVNGKIMQVGKDALNDIYVLLEAPAGYVHCSINDNQKDSVAKLNIGQIAFITGTCTGKTLGTPFIKNCNITTQ